MRKLLIASLLVLLLAIPGMAGDAPSVWNQFAATYHFSGYPQAISADFGDSYNGSNFATDFAGIKAAIAAELQTGSPPWNGDDLLNGSLENWP